MAKADKINYLGKIMIRITLLYILFLVLGYGQTDLQVEKYTLENGLTVILNPDKYASNVFGGVAI